ncbi:threonylcarbamoyl-AMP synthase [Natronorubrum sp. JWXQ-INN-674]|uniref:L-threonylcarbamoyladenylate synthase n=1 Tax=Natronorubrum halalkaliphilum TaxID=2691917 RepID=A0A6B0VJ27_9EURY|nr:L-threonylcarbamoyladenylate synthase [Natronorubrum halalkaliphilum]MXV61534.1 threonylcarbamoyl-AMP synthase [Natronorubrum halalkaliphilum]
MNADDLERAVTAIRDGGLVVYPTETVYGLGADALDSDAVERVFAVKGRDRSKPVSFAVPTFEAAVEEGYVRVSDREREFAEEFLPGPVTLLCERRGVISDTLTAGNDRVGVRVPDCEPALEFLEHAERPITATSANVSGEPSAKRVDDIGEQVLDEAVVLEADYLYDSPQRSAGDESEPASTVVDIASGTIHRRGALDDEIEAWLEEQ